MSVCLSVGQSVCMSMSVCLSVCLSVSLPLPPPALPQPCPSPASALPLPCPRPAPACPTLSKMLLRVCESPQHARASRSHATTGFQLQCHLWLCCGVVACKVQRGAKLPA